MQLNSTERRIILVTAAFLLICSGYFWGTNYSQLYAQKLNSAEMSASGNGNTAASADVPPLEQNITQTQSCETIQPVNLNTADLQQLTTLPGIGEVLAQRILDYRKAHGDFQTVQELTKVSGIGEKTLAKMLDYIIVG